MRTPKVSAPWVLKVGHRDITVIPLTRDDADDRGVVGLFSSIHSTIHVAEALCCPEQAATLLHELIHAAYHCFGLSSVPMDEEAVASALERPLATIMRDNPTLMVRIAAALTKGVPLV